MADFGIFKKKSNLFIFYCILPALSESGLEISLRHLETSLIGGSNPQSRGGLTPIFLENRIFCKNGHQILIFYPILTTNSSFFLYEHLVEEIITKVCISGKNHPKKQNFPTKRGKKKYICSNSQHNGPMKRGFYQ